MEQIYYYAGPAKYLLPAIEKELSLEEERVALDDEQIKHREEITDAE